MSTGTAEPTPLNRAALLLVGFSFGLSAFLSGYYELSAWGPLALVALAVALGLLLARPALPSGPAALAIGGLAAVAVWSLISTLWAESADQALIDGSRWLLYAVVLAALLLLLRGRDLGRYLLAGAIAPVLAFAGYVLVELAFGDGGELFLNNRLHEPLGYVNGMAAYMAIAIWPLVAVAERARSPVLGAAALAGATPLAGLALLSQSRGAIAAFALSAMILLALVPGRARRAWALLFFLAGVAACAGPIGDVIAELPSGAVAPDEGDIEAAVRALLLAGLGVGVAWLAASYGAAEVSERMGADRARTLSAVAIAAIAAVGCLAAVLPVSERADQVGEQYDAFTELSTVDTGSRLASGGGNRYDYWRIALDQFEEHPIRGAGAGNYDSAYFLERRTTEDVRQPHSVELEAMAGTGLIGAAALAAFLIGVLWALWLRSRRQGGAVDPGLAVAAGGAFLVWLLHTSVDWLHLIPGLTGIALCAAAALLAPWFRDELSLNGRARSVAVGGAIAAIAAAGYLIATLTIADGVRSDGAEQVDSDPRAALEQAEQSLDLNDEALPAYYLKAAALARLGAYDQARDALLEATRREPEDFVTWGLLGDLAARRGDLATAQRYYARASRLNPREDSLSRLAQDRAAIGQLAAEAGS